MEPPLKNVYVKRLVYRTEMTSSRSTSIYNVWALLLSREAEPLRLRGVAMCKEVLLICDNVSLDSWDEHVGCFAGTEDA
jgi:hypothetical protein